MEGFSQKIYPFLFGAQYVGEDSTDIFIFDRNTSLIEPVAVNPANDHLSSFSPDQRFILFNSFRTGNSDLYLLNLKTEKLERITDFSGYEAHGEFSPDGNKILFHRLISPRDDGGYNFDLYTYDLKKKTESNVTDSEYEESCGSWSPDGTSIVFSSDFDEKPEQHNLYVRDGSGNLTALTNGDWKDNYAYWTRDGNYIYFNSDREGNSSIYRIAMDGLKCKE